MLYNVDRWAYYTVQKLNIKPKYRIAVYPFDWPHPTPKQTRRMTKKSRKNQDYSIGVL